MPKAAEPPNTSAKRMTSIDRTLMAYLSVITHEEKPGQGGKHADGRHGRERNAVLAALGELYRRFDAVFPAQMAAGGGQPVPQDLHVDPGLPKLPVGHNQPHGINAGRDRTD